MDLTIPILHAREVLADRKRALPLMLAFAGYSFTGVTVPLFLLFCGDWWLPLTVDRGHHMATFPAAMIDVLLIILFGLQHSGMARQSFKKFITRWVHEAMERTVYVVMASLALWALCALWQPLPQPVWSADGTPGTILDLAFWIGFALVYTATLVLDHFHLLGLRQAYRQYVTRTPDATADQLQVKGPYRLVRHPLMTGLLISFWFTSAMSAGHLLLALGMTVYIVMGTIMEERDLVSKFYNAYRAYKEQVPAFFPFPFFLFRARKAIGADTGKEQNL